MGNTNCPNNLKIPKSWSWIPKSLNCRQKGELVNGSDRPLLCGILLFGGGLRRDGLDGL